jgi:hypothetical protein
MDHSNNILDNIKALFPWKRVRYFLLDVLCIFRERPIHQSSLSEFKKLSVISEFTVEDFSSSHRDPIVNLELRKNHPLFVDYHFGFLRTRLGHHGKKESR